MVYLCLQSVDENDIDKIMVKELIHRWGDNYTLLELYELLNGD